MQAFHQILTEPHRKLGGNQNQKARTQCLRLFLGLEPMIFSERFQILLRKPETANHSSSVQWDTGGVFSCTGQAHLRWRVWDKSYPIRMQGTPIVQQLP